MRRHWNPGSPLLTLCTRAFSRFLFSCLFIITISMDCHFVPPWQVTAFRNDVKWPTVVTAVSMVNPRWLPCAWDKLLKRAFFDRKNVVTTLPHLTSCPPVLICSSGATCVDTSDPLCNWTQPLPVSSADVIIACSNCWVLEVWRNLSVSFLASICN